MSKASMRLETALEFLSGEGKDIAQALKWLEKTFEAIASKSELDGLKNIYDSAEVGESDFKEKWVECLTKYESDQRNAVLEKLESEEDPSEELAKEAEAILLEMIEEGDADAEYKLSCLYDLDCFVGKEDESKRLLQNAADHGCEEAKSVIQGAARMAEEKAESGDSWGMITLAQQYMAGDGRDKDVLTAIEWYEKAVEAGNAVAAKQLASMYAEGDCVRQDDKKALTWYQKAAEMGDVMAQFNYATCLRLGKGCEQDNELAARWFNKAAKAGLAEAQSAIGDCYKYGWGVDKDYEVAAEWYEKAADQHELGAMNELSEIFLSGGDGIERNEEDGVSLLETAAEEGHAKSQWMLGMMTFNPEAFSITSISQNIDKAVALIKKSAAQEFGMAEKILADLYLQGVGVEKNATEAKRYYERALEHGGLLAEVKTDAEEILKTLQ